jgi:hypothetical protein
MPHFIAEYTDNIEQQADLPGLFEKVHETRVTWRVPHRWNPQPGRAPGHLAHGRRQA